MCGIFACSTKQSDAVLRVINGLKRLEYRGYDSWGIGYIEQNNKQITISKKVGKISDSHVSILSSSLAIGHTRWATHGGVTNMNAHPHFSTDKSFILAQNGIVENYLELKNQLIKKGYSFITETDTEVIVRLIEEKLTKNNSIIIAVRRAFKELKGRNTIILLTNKGEIIAARNGSPLVIGLSEKNNSFYLSSDVVSFGESTNQTIFIDNEQMVYVNNGTYTLYNLKNGNKIKPILEKYTISKISSNKGKYSHYMIKEIFDTPNALQPLLKIDYKTYLPFIHAIKNAKQVYTIGSGTAGAAAAQIAYYLRVYPKINAISLIGAEAAEYLHLFNKHDLIIAPSQSGETADVLEILELAKKKHILIASYINMPESMMTRISDFKFMAHVGPEICVMSTKIFTSQIAWGYITAKIAEGKKTSGIKNLWIAQNEIRKYLNDKNNHHLLKKLTEILIHSKDIFLLSKGQNLQIVKEGMVKMIEGSYIHAHAIPAGDLKHYAITLIEKGVPVIFVMSKDEFYSDIMSSIHEVKARGGYIIGLSPIDSPDFDMHIPVPNIPEVSAITNIIPLQLLAYYMAVKLGNNVDKPRNIAKSVTVK